MSDLPEVLMEIAMRMRRRTVTSDDPYKVEEAALLLRQIRKEQRRDSIGQRKVKDAE